MEEQKLIKKKLKASENPSALLAACTDLASYYTSVGQYSKAVKEYEELCNIYKDQRQMLLYAQAQRGLGEAYMGLLDFNKTLQHFKIYHEIAVQEQNPLEQQRALAQLGHLYLTWFLETLSENNRKLLDDAYMYFVRSMKKCETLPDGVEKQDMMARLFSNLGLVKEYLGDYDTSFKLYEKSIKICLKHDFFEQLYRGYLSVASLFEKQDNYHDTIKNFNLAVEVAKKLSTKRAELICGALLAKAETLIKLADFQGAKQVLRKAYKFKTPNKIERKLIEKDLRIVAGMCKIEDEVITCNDQKQLKGMYEKMGDGACDLKNFSKAIEYYKKMLEVAERTGVSDKELGECYYSLGETYKDNGNYKEAELYFEKEYDLCKNNLKDSLNTVCKIADLKEMANDDPESIKAVYERGLANCRKRHNLKEERRLGLRYMEFLKRSFCHKDAFMLERHLERLEEQLGDDGRESSSSEFESENSEAKFPVGEDIVLSDVTDISEESDGEVPESAQQAKRRKQNTVKFKKNLNGEWPLHVACIKGNLKMVKYWLDVDHPVNVRDNAGWLPLHEAAVHGHLDIVELLLDRKASINDRGGSECNGITPLHDAASNGHLEVVQLLLERGASAVAKTDDGNTPLFELKRWYERVEGDVYGERLQLYKTLIKRLQDALDKAGQKDTVTAANKENEICNTSGKVGQMRRNFYLADESPEKDLEEDGASGEYQKVMQTLRHKSCSAQKQSPIASSKRAALIDEDHFIDADDWLEEDVKPAKSKKRKTGSGEFVLSRNTSMGSSKSPAKARTRSPELSVAGELFIGEDFECFPSTSNQRRYSNASSDSSRSGKKKQATLLDAGFSRERGSKSPILRRSLSLKRFGSDHSVGSNYSTTSNIHAEPDSTSTLANRSPFKTADPYPIQGTFMATQSDPMLFVDVEIEKKVFRVPILMSQVQIRNIKWLAQEAAHRYESKEFMKPLVELETVNGAILDENDPLNLLFPLGSMKAERVVGRVVEWKLPSVMERYREICGNMGVDPNVALCFLIETLSVSLDLSDQGLLFTDLNPLLKSIINQKSLTQLDLSGNFLNSQSVNLLSATMATLSNLEVLNLSCTGLQRSHVTQLANSIAASAPTLSKLSHLDLSDNIALKNGFLKDLGVIGSNLVLRKVNLSNTGLSEPLNDEVALKSVEDFDISYNELSDPGIRRVISWLDAAVVKTLNVSRNRTQNALRQILDVFDGGPMVLEKINLMECGVADTDLFQLLRFAPNICSIDASHNPDITSISLRRLLEHGSLNYVNLCYCQNIWNYFDPAESGWDVGLDASAHKAVFKVCASPDFRESIERMFRRRFSSGLKVEQRRGVLTVILHSS